MIEAAIIGSVIGGVSSIFSANKKAKSEKDALNFQRNVYNENVARTQPYLDAGTGALNTYRTALGLNGREAQTGFYSDFQTDPGFEFSLNKGLDEAQRAAAARGEWGGNLYDDLRRRGQDAMYGQYESRLTRLFDLTKLGASQNATLLGAGQNYADSASKHIAGAGNAEAAGILGVGNAVNQGINNYGTWQAIGAGKSSYGASGGGNQLSGLVPVTGGMR